MSEVKTIHIFGYGETQCIGKNINKKVSSVGLTGLQNVVDNIFSKKPTENDATNEYHSINICKDMFVDYLPKTKGQKSFRVPYNEVDSVLIDTLIAEVEAVVEA